MEKKWVYVVLLLPLITGIVASVVEQRVVLQDGNEKELPNASFNVVQATRILFIAFSTFCPTSSLSDWTCPWCKMIPGVKYVDSVSSTFWEGDTFSIVAIANNTGTSYRSIISAFIDPYAVYIAFRGSSNVPNWIYDFVFTQVDYPNVNGAKVHLGFYTAYNNQKQKLHQILQQKVFDPAHGACPKCNKIICTGHSLGGAMALLCGADFAVTYPKIPVSVWNYGQPRVGNINFANFVRSKLDELWRVVHARDIVPHLPPADFGYHHAPTEIWNNASNSSCVQCSSTNGEDPKCSDSLHVLNPVDHLTYLGYHIGSKHC